MTIFPVPYLCNVLLMLREELHPCSNTRIILIDFVPRNPSIPALASLFRSLQAPNRRFDVLLTLEDLECQP